MVPELHRRMITFGPRALLVIACAGSAHAELPETPDQLVTQLQQVMQSGDADTYAELLSSAFVYVAASSEADSLDKDEEVALYRRFLAGIESLSVEVAAQDRIEQGDFAWISARLDILVLTSPSDGYRLSSVHELTLARQSAGWQIARWNETAPPGDSGDHPTWYSVKRRFADTSTAVRDQSWGLIKQYLRD